MNRELAQILKVFEPFKQQIGFDEIFLVTWLESDTVDMHNIEAPQHLRKVKKLAERTDLSNNYIISCLLLQSNSQSLMSAFPMGGMPM